MEPLGDGDPKRIGPYRLRARLGAGAMGQVFLGETRDKRQAAVKLLRAEFAASPEFRRRFGRESAAARSVSSARTVPVVDANPEAARPWLATVYVPGPTLQEYVAASGLLRPAVVAALGAGLTEGLAAIHAGGLVHRDLKPGNVIIADHGPVIIDFGISRAVDASTLTATGTVLGTYGYMAPEQVTADTATAASDVFALGCVLAFAATGKGPFDASTIPAVIHRVVGEPPELGALAGELRDVVEACLAKDPGGRPGVRELYARLSALAGGTGAPTRIDPMAGAFPGFSPGRVDAATRMSVGGPTRRLRRPGASRPDRPRRRLGRRALLIGGAAAVAAAAVPTGWLYWSRRHRITGDEVDHVAFSGDGRYLAATNFEGGGWIWNAETRKLVADFSGEGTSQFWLESSPDGSTLASGGDNVPITFRDPATGSVTRLIDSPLEAVYCAAFSPDGTRLALGGGTYGSEVAPCVVLDVESGELIESQMLPESNIDVAWSVAFADDGGALLIAGQVDYDLDSGYNDDMDAFWRWDFGSGEVAAFGPGGQGRAVAASGDGRIAVGGSGGCWLSLGSDETDLAQLNGVFTSVLAFSSDGSVLASADDEVVRLRDAETALEQAVVAEGERSALAFSTDGAHLAIGSSDFGDAGCWLWPLE